MGTYAGDPQTLSLGLLLVRELAEAMSGNRD